LLVPRVADPRRCEPLLVVGAAVAVPSVVGAAAVLAVASRCRAMSSTSEAAAVARGEWMRTQKLRCVSRALLRTRGARAESWLCVCCL
jgi:hypothetical protein